MGRLRIVAALALGLLAALAAPPRHASAAIPVDSPCSPRTFRRYTYVVVIAFENHDYQQVLGSNAPPSYFKTLAGRCGVAIDFNAVSVPRSLPNYLAVTSGSTAGITKDCQPGPHCESSSPSIFGQVGTTQWRAWGESMPTPCGQQEHGLYAPRHVPAVYYTRIAHQICVHNALPITTPFAGIGRSFTWITPNLDHDMHNGTLAQASSWLQNFLAGPEGLLRRPSYQAGHEAIFIWFDTGSGSDPVRTPIPLIVIAPSVGHRVVANRLNDYHLLHGWEGMLGRPCLNNACQVSGFDALFNL